jgi:hypothetical protein
MDVPHIDYNPQQQTITEQNNLKGFFVTISTILA